MQISLFVNNILYKGLINYIILKKYVFKNQKP